MAKAELTTRTLGETEFASWNEFVAEAPSGSLYARTEYLDALCSATGGRFHVLAVHQGEQLVGGIGLYEEASRHGTFVSSRLLLYYNGPVVRQHDTKYPSEQTARHLKVLTVLEGELQRAGYGSISLKPRSTLVDVRPFLARGWTASHGYSYAVPIADLEQAWSRIEQNLRRLIDRCGRADVTFTADDDFDSFFRLHSDTMDRVDFRVYLPEVAFRSFYLTTHTVSAGADPEHFKSGVSAFVRWKSFEYLSGLAYTGNDLTDASPNPMTHFKSQLGGALVPLVELHGPESARYRWGTRLTTLAGTGRHAAGALVRRTLRRPPGAARG